MSAAAKQKKIDELAARVSESLARRAYFEAERMAFKALMMARQDQEFGRMADIAAPLCEARRQRVKPALSAARVTLISTEINEETKVKRGCYLVQPPLVAADARRLRLAALQQEVAAAVLCREPLTQLKLQPVVALSPGQTIRAKIEPPDDYDAPDLPWFIGALQELGEAAIESIDADLPIIKRIDALLDRLDALPEHDGLHEALEAACRQAHAENARDTEAAAARRAIAALDESDESEESPPSRVAPAAFSSGKPPGKTARLKT